MTDNEVRQLMIAFARLEQKVDDLKDDVAELKDWRAKVLMIVVSAVIVAGITALIGSGVVRV
jgi:hypothetical protein